MFLRRALVSSCFFMGWDQLLLYVKSFEKPAIITSCPFSTSFSDTQPRQERKRGWRHQQPLSSPLPCEAAAGHSHVEQLHIKRYLQNSQDAKTPSLPEPRSAKTRNLLKHILKKTVKTQSNHCLRPEQLRGPGEPGGCRGQR